MEVVHGVRSFTPDRPSAVTVGFFDGVHLGHQAVIRRTVQVARGRGLRPVAVTFDRHPREVLTPGRVPLLLTTLRRKASLIEGLGVELLAVMEFTPEVTRWPPEAFVDRVLVGGLGARSAVVGENFTFGHRAAGTVAVLAELGASRGVEVEGVPLAGVEGRPVSSTSIREALQRGDLSWPALALGRRYEVEGTVVAGAGRGSDLGFPTANLATPPRLLLPGRGIYAGTATVEGRTWVAAISVGTNPTFGEEPLHVEAHLLGFVGDILGRVVTVEFWERLRDEARFDTPEELARAMAEDVVRTRRVVPIGAGGVPR